MQELSLFAIANNTFNSMAGSIVFLLMNVLISNPWKCCFTAALQWPSAVTAQTDARVESDYSAPVI